MIACIYILIANLLVPYVMSPMHGRPIAQTRTPETSMSAIVNNTNLFFYNFFNKEKYYLKLLVYSKKKSVN